MIETLLPHEPQGLLGVEDRGFLDGIFWVLQSGTPWHDLPERHLLRPLRAMAEGSCSGTVYGPYHRTHNGVVQMIDSNLLAPI